MRVFRRMRHGDYDERGLEQQLDSRGFMNRFLGRATRAVRQPWQMYPVGVLFGLGFDTATEVALLATAGAATTSGLPFYAILCLPILFAAGMSLLDTIDGAFMNFAYGWAFSQARAQGLLQHHHHGAVGRGRAAHRDHRAASRCSPTSSASPGRSWTGSTAWTSTSIGYVIVVLFVVTWAVALARVALRAHRGALDGAPDRREGCLTRPGVRGAASRCR